MSTRIGHPSLRGRHQLKMLPIARPACRKQVANVLSGGRTEMSGGRGRTRRRRGQRGGALVLLRGLLDHLPVRGGGADAFAATAGHRQGSAVDSGTTTDLRTQSSPHGLRWVSVTGSSSWRSWREQGDVIAVFRQQVGGPQRHEVDRWPVLAPRQLRLDLVELLRNETLGQASGDQLVELGDEVVGRSRYVCQPRRAVRWERAGGRSLELSQAERALRAGGEGAAPATKSRLGVGASLKAWAEAA